jgi:WD40 repeat protein
MNSGGSLGINSKRQPSEAASSAAVFGMPTGKSRIKLRWIRDRGCAAAIAGTALAMASAIGAGASTSPAEVTRASSASPFHAAARSGAQLWIERYNDRWDGSDVATSVAVSPSGRAVYVTGYSDDATAEDDEYATVAYSAATGAQLWVERYNGSTNHGGAAYSTAVSPSGKAVFVTGEGFIGTSAERGKYATIAYNAATGARLWAKTYDGSPNHDGVAYALAVSPSGKTVFVSGETPDSDASSQPYATIAYNAATGARLWAKTYHFAIPSSYAADYLAVSPSGKMVYITNVNGLGYATVAYSAATGAQLWAKDYRYRATTDVATAITVSPSGKTVFVTGSYDGDQVIVAGAGYLTVAYSAATGARLWAKLSVTNGGGDGTGVDIPYSAAVSPSGRTLFVTGSAAANSAYAKYETIAYEAATGARLWARTYYPVRGLNVAHALAVSPSGANVYVTGSTGIGAYATIAYNAATGARLWARTHDAVSPSLSADGLGGGADAIAVSRATGAVFVTGGLVSAYVDSFDYTTIAYQG